MNNTTQRLTVVAAILVAVIIIVRALHRAYGGY
jgi:hypothetical protein